MKWLRIKDLEEKLGFKKTKIYYLIKQGRFPKPQKVDFSSVWLESEVEAAFTRLLADDEALEKLKPA